MEQLTFNNSPLHHNDMVVRVNRREVIEDLFPEVAQAIANTERDVRLEAEPVIRYRNQAIGVNHHVIGEERGKEKYDLTFTVNFGFAPRGFDTLVAAFEYIDGLLTVETDYDAPLRQTGEGSLTC